MLIKVADDKQGTVDTLKALLARAEGTGPVRARIEQEIRNVRSGMKGEHDAVYEIEFHYGSRPGVMTIHDLRLDIDGRVAQIDHLILNRLLQIWVCESKAFAEGVGVNEHGEWVAFYAGRPQGIPSPIQQNKRHIAVLTDALSKQVELPTRVGITLRPEIKSVVLVSNSARISRPRGRAAARVDGLDSVMKVEQLVATINRSIDERSASLVAALASLATFVSAETVERLARRLAALHKPQVIDWSARFGFPPEPSAPTPAASPTEPRDARRVAAAAPRQVIEVCASCGDAVSVKVAEYSRANSERFAGRILCYTCQRTVGRRK